MRAAFYADVIRAPSRVLDECFYLYQDEMYQPSVFDFLCNELFCLTACPNMTILTGTSGIIKSPFYPGYYGNGQNCSWKITASSGNRVKLVITDMDIELGGSNCGKDFIQIQNGFLHGSGVPPGRLCGTLTSNSTFASYRETLIVRFVTDGSLTRRGFKATYTQVALGRK